MSDDPGASAIATSSQTLGPFFHFGLTTNLKLGKLAPDDAPGERVRVRMRVLDGDGMPLPDAMIEVYQADARGRYGQPGFPGFGRLPTDDNGTCVFETIRPGAVRGPDGRVEAPHLDLCLFARGLLRHLYTRMYFQGDTSLDEDPFLGLIPAGRRATLLAVCGDEAATPRTWDFVIRLQGDEETVFFDI